MNTYKTRSKNTATVRKRALWRYCGGAAIWPVSPAAFADSTPFPANSPQSCATACLECRPDATPQGTWLPLDRKHTDLSAGARSAEEEARCVPGGDRGRALQRPSVPEVDTSLGAWRRFTREGWKPAVLGRGLEALGPRCGQDDRGPTCGLEALGPRCGQDDRGPRCGLEDRGPRCGLDDRGPREHLCP